MMASLLDLQLWFSGLESSDWLIALSIAVLLPLLLLIALLCSARRSRKRAALLGEMQRELDELLAASDRQQESLASLDTELATSRQQLLLQQQDRDELRDQLDGLNERYREHSATATGTEQRLLAEKRSLQEKLDSLEQNRQQLATEFELLANRIFDEKTQRFAKSSEQQLQSTLAPFKQQLGDFRKRVDDIYSNEAKERHLLAEQINQLRAESLRISEDANNLTNALKFENKTQGNWGELTLIRALEMCGLKEPEEYETQVSFKSDTVGSAGSSRQVPDVIVHLPGGKDIIIDSKVSLLAYSRYFEAETDEQRREALDAHVQSVTQHVRQLSDKSYQQLPGVTTLDYVMLYIPVEGASAMALQHHRNLWEEAYRKNIVLVSPTNLLAILRSVETIWRHEKQNKNAEEIARQAGNLHDKFVLMIESLEGVGKSLESAQRAYDKAYSQLSEGRGNLVSSVQRLEKLGAKTRKAIPDSLLTDAQGQEGDSTGTAEVAHKALEELD